MKQAAVLDRLQQALQHHRAGRLDEAGQLYAQLRRAAPRNFDAVHLAGTVALQQGRLAEAEAALAQARRLDARSAVCAMRHGLACHGLGRTEEAEAALRKALALDAALPEGWFHLGSVLRTLGRIDEGIAAYRRAIALSPQYAEAHDRLGALLAGSRGYGEAEPHFRRAAELQPALAVAWCNLGVCLIFLGRLGEALTAFDRALAADPRFDHAHAGRGLALSKCYRQAAAVEAYGRALALNPRNHEARSARLYELQYVGEISREALFQEHVKFGAAVAEGLPAAPARPAAKAARGEGPDSAERRLRVGFISPDLHRHSVSYFLEPLLEHLDRDQFEIFLYHDHPLFDSTSERLSALATAWRPIAGLPADRVEAMVRADAPDMLIDLAGHTGSNRLPLFARRLAPVQATYLGYPDTTGLPAMDYRLVDPTTDPAGEGDAFATEKLVRFASTAWSYAPPADAPEPAAGPASRGGGVAFGCFNHFAKVTDRTLRAWGRLLAAVPDGRLVLKGHGLGLEKFQGDIRRRLAAAGIAPERVELVERTRTIGEHLASYARVDVALDTFPYNGTTTTCEALWMGVPVVALAGDRHAARVGASLLAAVGHADWVARDEDEYVAKAAALARSAPSGARTALREAMRRSPLLDHRGQADRFGAAVRGLWRDHCRSQTG
jgi:protein O-GlcNAc transferase